MTCQLYREGAIAEEDFDPSLVSRFLEEQDTLVWLDLEEPSPTELEMLQEEFAIHPLAIEDARHRNQRPKVEAYEGYFFIVLHALQLRDDEIEDQEIHVFVGNGYLVTLRYTPAFDLAEVRRRWKQEQELAREGGGYLLHALLDEVVDGYFEAINGFELLAEGVEDVVFGDQAAEDVQEQVFQLRKRLIAFRRQVMPLREVLDLLEENRDVVTKELRPYYRDVADHVIRSLEAVDNLREVLASMLDAHLSRVSTQLNVVMKQVTSWAAIILAPTLVAGIYGMNFRFMPELDWRLGYPFALGLMFLSSFVLYRIFKRRDWL
ncbi:MAG: magnesium/cobalt transporter CorA [Actinomycetota bacterium]|nr:magnesium/cobalt transporter CorA [Actinomycetota bacterium]